MKKMLMMCAVALAAVGVQAELDENGIEPKHWYKFDGNLNSSGATALSIGGESGSSYVESVKDGQAYQFKDGCHPYGSGIARGSGDFTYVTVAKTANLDHGIIWAMGTRGSPYGFALVAVGATQVAVRVFGSSWSSSGSDIITATVSDASESYHVYSLVYTDSDKTFKLYVDEASKPAGSGTVSSSASTVFTNSNFQWGHLNQGLSYSMVTGIGCCLDDFRLYQQALTTAQIKNIVATFRDLPFVWGTAGWAGKGVSTKNDGAFHSASWTFNFSKDDGIVHDDIDLTRRVSVTKIRMMQRQTTAEKPTAATLTQGANTMTATSVTSYDDETGMTLYNSSGMAAKTWAYHEFIFPGDVDFDPTQNIMLSFGENVGCWGTQPANSVMGVSGWSPVIEITAIPPSEAANYTATINQDTTFTGITSWNPSRPTTFESSDILEIKNAAPVTLTMDEAIAVKMLKIVNAEGSALKLDMQVMPTIGTYDFSKALGGVILDTSGLDGTELAKKTAYGAPYSHWLLKGTVKGSEHVTVTPPTMPSGYDVATVIDDWGVRVVVTAPRAAKFGSVNVNFAGGRGSALANDSMVGTLTTEVGGHPVVGTSWNDLRAANQTDTTLPKYVKTDGTVVTSADIKLTASQVANPYTSGAVAHMLITGYMDDSQSPIVQISKIPFSKYRVILYRATDTGGTTFSAAQIGTTASNAKIYYGPEKSNTGVKYTVQGSTENDWGKSDKRDGCREGVNYIVSDVLEGTAGSATVYINSNKHAGRAGVAAIQIVEVGHIAEDITGFKSTISAAGTYNLTDLEWNPKPFSPNVDTDVTITIDPAVMGEVTINLDKSNMSVKDFVLASGGDATVTLTGNNPAAISQWDFSDTQGRVSFGFSDFDESKVVKGDYPRLGLAYPYTGTIQSGYDYIGTGNKLTFTTFNSGSVLIGGSGTLHGDLNVLGRAEVYVGGTYTSPGDDVEFSCSDGYLTVLEGADISVTSICCYRNRAWGGTLGELNIYGTLRVTSECDSDVGSQITNHKGVILKRDNASTGMNITIGPKGAFLAEKSWIMLNREPQGTCIVRINGGIVKARGINVGNYVLVYAPNPSITVTDGGILSLREGLVSQTKGVFSFSDGTLQSWGGSFTWDPCTTTVETGKTLKVDATGGDICMTAGLVNNGLVKVVSGNLVFLETEIPGVCVTEGTGKIYVARARISSATAPIFALARDCCLSRLHLGG